VSGDFTPDDPVIALQAAIDQESAQAPLYARLFKAQFDAYVEEGFDRKAALYLIIGNFKDTPGSPS
jgi:hypothetical protein